LLTHACPVTAFSTHSKQPKTPKTPPKHPKQPKTPQNSTAEIDRVTKKVDEGVELFDEIWEKVYSAESQNQKEKHEIDLKKEIKKLQRLRDQIKTWIGSSDVKDKDSLVDYRKLIETKMEQFKVCEKETKTKTYSKEGLARAEKLSPEEQAKIETCKWVGETIEKLQQLVEDRDVEIERLSAGKGKKTNKHMIEEYNEIIASHKFHIHKLEGIMRLVMNDRLEPNRVDDMKDDIDYYVEAHEEEDYMQAYDEEMFYDDLRLDELGVVDVDRVTHAATDTKRTKSDDASSANSGSHKSKSTSKKNAGHGMVPLNIGRARVSSSGPNNSSSNSSNPNSNNSTSSSSTNKHSGSSSVGETGSSTPTKKSGSLGPTPTVPTARVVTAVNGTPGASMAAILKREGEQQEKERLKQAALVQQ
jgi:CCR4-NOT transcription complex subunit 3